MRRAVGGTAWTLLLAMGVCNCAPAEPSACDGFADRKMGITAAEYRPCAADIIQALDTLAPPVRAIVNGGATVADRDTARDAMNTLRRLVRDTGMESDLRSMNPGTEITKWASGDISSFNQAVVTAMTHYRAVLAYPNADNLGQAARAHDQAKRSYARIR